MKNGEKFSTAITADISQRSCMRLFIVQYFRKQNKQVRSFTRPHPVRWWILFLSSMSRWWWIVPLIPAPALESWSRGSPGVSPWRRSPHLSKGVTLLPSSVHKRCVALINDTFFAFSLLFRKWMIYKSAEILLELKIIWNLQKLGNTNTKIKLNIPGLNTQYINVLYYLASLQYTFVHDCGIWGFCQLHKARPQ